MTLVLTGHLTREFAEPEIRGFAFFYRVAGSGCSD